MSNADDPKSLRHDENDSTVCVWPQRVVQNEGENTYCCFQCWDTKKISQTSRAIQQSLPNSCTLLVFLLHRVDSKAEIKRTCLPLPQQWASRASNGSSSNGADLPLSRTHPCMCHTSTGKYSHRSMNARVFLCYSAWFWRGARSSWRVVRSCRKPAAGTQIFVLPKCDYEHPASHCSWETIDTTLYSHTIILPIQQPDNKKHPAKRDGKFRTDIAISKSEWLLPLLTPIAGNGRMIDAVR